MIPSTELLRLTGIKNAKTLTRWHQLGIIPAPVIGTHPNGKGKIAYYEPWVADRIIRVQHFVRAGRSLHDAAMLATEQAHAATITKTTDVAGNAVPVGEVFLDLVIQFIERLVPNARDSWRQRLESAGVFAAAVEHVQRGENPILILTRTECSVVPDYGVSVGLSTLKTFSVAREPMLLVPLALLFGQLNIRVGGRGGFDYKVTPVARVYVSGARHRDSERGVIHAPAPSAFWSGFAVQSTGQRPTSVPRRAQKKVPKGKKEK